MEDIYKALLKKYIGHVIESEGIDFLSQSYVGDDKDIGKHSPFTDDEFSKLIEMSNDQYTRKGYTDSEG